MTFTDDTMARLWRAALDAEPHEGDDLDPPIVDEHTLQWIERVLREAGLEHD